MNTPMNTPMNKLHNRAELPTRIGGGGGSTGANACHWHPDFLYLTRYRI